ncbi:MAG: helix-turn-helix transcriptional regulator [Deltaproteobacteria bacterium]|nr:helix-turn-helix transcriptional regulator [Deltaproteobacteria bacterium]
MTVSVELPTSLPGLRAVRTTTSSLLSGVKHYHAVGRLEHGAIEWWGRGRVWQSTPGAIQIKEPGDVHRDLARRGASVFTVITLPSEEIEHAREAGRVVSSAQLDPGDTRAVPFHRLHDAVIANADRLALEVILAEAILTFSRLREARPGHSRPVRRAMDYLHAHLAESITLDDLASHASLDKFHLCRAFRAQIGMPPHAYLTHLRVQRAKELLASGARASELAPRVGLYDQSQLTRHFRRIVGTTPGRYANERRGTARAGRA